MKPHKIRSAAPPRKVRSKKLIRLITASDLIAMVESLDLEQLVDLARFTSGSTGDETYQIGASTWMHDNGIRMERKQ